MAVAPRRMGRSTLIIFLFTTKQPPITEVKPSTSNVFAMFDPTTFPITISECPPITEITEVAISGSDVPRATIVTPIMNGDSLK